MKGIQALVVLYSHLRNSMNEPTNTFLYKNISLTLYSRKGWCFCGVWEMGGETYTQRGLLLPISSSRSQGVPTLAPLASSSEMPLIDCVSLAQLWFSALCPNLTTWFSSRGLLPVTHLFDLSDLTCRNLPVYYSKCDSLPKHTGSPGMNQKSMAYVI